MKIGVITDIHGNYFALKEVLAELERYPVDLIYCLGDLITIGPQTNEVLETLFTLDPIKIILGNHDEHVLAILDGKEVPKTSKGEKEHHEWIAETINPQFVKGLRDLPRIRT